MSALALPWVLTSIVEERGHRCRNGELSRRHWPPACPAWSRSRRLSASLKRRLWPSRGRGTMGP